MMVVRGEVSPLTKLGVGVVSVSCLYKILVCVVVIECSIMFYFILLHVCVGVRLLSDNHRI